MNRQQRRAMEKSQKRVNRHLGTAYRALQQQVDNDKTQALLACFIISLNEIYGFGQQECMAVLNKIDEHMCGVTNGMETLQELINRAQDTVGIQIVC